MLHKKNSQKKILTGTNYSAVPPVFFALMFPCRKYFHSENGQNTLSHLTRANVRNYTATHPSSRRLRCEIQDFICSLRKFPADDFLSLSENEPLLCTIQAFFFTAFYHNEFQKKSQVKELSSSLSFFLFFTSTLLTGLKYRFRYAPIIIMYIQKYIQRSTIIIMERLPYTP